MILAYTTWKEFQKVQKYEEMIYRLLKQKYLKEQSSNNDDKQKGGD